MKEKLFKHKLTRLGSKNDGGYFVCSNSISKSQNLIGIGIETNWEFEKEFLIKNPDVKIFTFDGQTNFFLILKFFCTQLLKIFLLKLDLDLLRRSFLNIFEYYFLLIKKLNFVKKNIELKGGLSLSKVMEGKKNIFMKIDIEGSEYRILDEIINQKKKITGLVIEFHDYDLNKEKIYQFINSIDLKLIHININELGGISIDNHPLVVELTFSKDPIKSYVEKSIFEIPNSKIMNFISVDDVKL